MSQPNMDEKDHPITEAPSVPQPGYIEAQKVDNRQADKAAVYLNNTEHYEPLTPEEEKKVMRKTDWILLPMVRLMLQIGKVRYDEQHANTYFPAL